jgi:hypothetical protein
MMIFYYCGSKEARRHMPIDFDFKRSHERKIYNTNIVFAYQDRAYQGTMKNLSLGGAFIETGSVNQVSIGDVVTVSIPYTSGKKNLKKRGRIKWQNDVGFAIEFF